MLNHLNKKNQRLINHLTQLNNCIHGCSVTELASFSSCSDRTVYSDIDLIDYYYNDLITLKINNGQVVMDKHGSGSLNHVINDIIKQDLNFQLLLSFYTDANEPIEHFAVKHAVSVQSAHNARKTINQALKNYQIEILSINGKYQIKGKSESQLQILLGHFIYFVGIPNETQLDEYWKTFSQTENLDMITNQFFTTEKDVRMLFTTSYIRLKSFHHKPSYNSVKDNVYTLLKYLENIKTQLEPIVDDFIKEFLVIADENQFNYDKSTLSEFKDLLMYAYLLNFILREDTYTSQFRIRNFIFNFKKENPLFYQKTYEIIEKQNLPSEICQLTDTIIHLSYLNFQTIRNYKESHLLVISDLSLKHAEILVNRFKKHFPMHHFTACYLTPHQLSEQTNNLIVFEFIIATAKIQISKEHQVIYVSDFPDSQDIKRIYETLYYKQ